MNICNSLPGIIGFNVYKIYYYYTSGKDPAYGYSSPKYCNHFFKIIISTWTNDDVEALVGPVLEEPVRHVVLLSCHLPQVPGMEMVGP